MPDDVAGGDFIAIDDQWYDGSLWAMALGPSVDGGGSPLGVVRERPICVGLILEGAV